MSVEIIRKTKEQHKILSQVVSQRDVFIRINDFWGITSYIVLPAGDNLNLYQLDNMGRFSEDNIETVEDAIRALDHLKNSTSIEYIRQPQIDVRVTVKESMEVL